MAPRASRIQTAPLAEAKSDLDPDVRAALQGSAAASDRPASLLMLAMPIPLRALDRDAAIGRGDEPKSTHCLMPSPLFPWYACAELKGPLRRI